jgi:hypothetical protein
MEFLRIFWFAILCYTVLHEISSPKPSFLPCAGAFFFSKGCGAPIPWKKAENRAARAALFR